MPSLTTTVVASGAVETSSILFSIPLDTHSIQQPRAPHQVLVVKALPLAALAGPLMAAGKTVAAQGLRGAAMTGAKKLGTGAAMGSAMEKLRQRQQEKEAERRQRSSELMEAGRERASSGSTTMGS